MIRVAFGLRSVVEYDFLAGDPESLLIRLVDAGVRPLSALSEKSRSISRVLLIFPNVLITAHQAFLTQEALREIARVTRESTPPRVNV